MTDNEIIKGLEEMAADCEYNFSAKVLALINRQKAEIERLKETPKCVYAYDGEMMEYCVEAPCPNFKTEEEIKAEAIKGFAEKLKEKSGKSVICCNGEEIYGTKQYSINAETLDNLVKEMVGADNAE